MGALCDATLHRFARKYKSFIAIRISPLAPSAGVLGDFVNHLAALSKSMAVVQKELKVNDLPLACMILQG